MLSLLSSRRSNNGRKGAWNDTERPKGVSSDWPTRHIYLDISSNAVREVARRVHDSSKKYCEAVAKILQDLEETRGFGLTNREDGRSKFRDFHGRDSCAKDKEDRRSVSGVVIMLGERLLLRGSISYYLGGHVEKGRWPHQAFGGHCREKVDLARR